MKRTLLICFFALLASWVNAQKIYFIYLQTETGEPFFVRMNDKLYNSEPSGYLILPKLKDSTYKFDLGFPGKDVDLNFTTAINKKDHGYLVKNLGDKGWGLFDFQSLDLQISASGVKKETGFSNSANTTEPQVNAFTALLAQATDDPSLRQNAVFANEVAKKPVVTQTIEKEVQKESPKESNGSSGENKSLVADAVAKEDKNVVTQPAAKTVEQKADVAKITAPKEDSQKTSVVQTDVYKKSEVTRVSEGSSADGFESVFVDQNSDGTKDTIRVFIPADKTSIAKEEQVTGSVGAKDSDTAADTASHVKEESKKEENRKWWQISIGKNKNETAGKEDSKNNHGSDTKDLSDSSDTSQAVSDPKQESKKEETKKWWQISLGKDKSEATGTKKCQAADNDDFLKLRRKMAARTNDDGMLEEARKYFKSKCFSTEQIKNLSTMFLSSAGKYNFFNAAYDYTTDVENFPSLQSELKDENYASRFKEMLHN